MMQQASSQRSRMENGSWYSLMQYCSLGHTGGTAHCVTLRRNSYCVLRVRIAYPEF